MTSLNLRLVTYLAIIVLLSTMHKHVPLETTSLVQIYLQCLQMKANMCPESIFQLTTIEEINVAQKRNFSHL